MKNHTICFLLALTCIASLRAATTDDIIANTTTDDKTVVVGSTTPTAPNTRYGIFNQYDHRSDYGQGVYPEPFLVDDTDLETNEARFDWVHTVGHAAQGNVLTAEVEKGFGLVTLEVEVPYVSSKDEGVATRGLDNIDVGIRFPIYDWVSASGFINTTFGLAFEVGIPMFNQVSVNPELVPKVFNDIAIGKHFTLQTIVGWSSFVGRGEDGGVQSLEYGFIFGWTIQHAELPIPGVEQLIPMVEILGDDVLTKEDAGSSALSADAGFRVNLKPIAGVQPRLGAAFIFPLDRGGKEDQHWGFVLSSVFEY